MSVDTKITIVNKPFGFIPQDPATSMQWQNIIIPTYMSNSKYITYQGLIKTKTIISPVAITLIPINKN